MSYDQISKEVDDLFRTLQGIIIAGLIYFGAFIVAAVPAVITGMGVAQLFREVTQYAGLIGWLIGIALEVVNIVVIHTASEFYSDKPTGRFWILVGLIPVYVIGVEWVVYHSDGAFPELVKSLGYVSPFFAIAVFIAVMFNQWHKATVARAEGEKEDATRQQTERDKLEIERQMERERIELEHQQEMERLAMEQRHTERMARIEAKKGEISDTKSPRNFAKKRTSKEEKREIALNIVREFPTVSGAELGRRLDASERTGQNILNELEAAGVIHRNGGNEWKVN